MLNENKLLARTYMMGFVCNFISMIKNKKL